MEGSIFLFSSFVKKRVQTLEGDIIGNITFDGIDCYENSSFHKNFNKFASNISIMEHEINQNIISVNIKEDLGPKRQRMLLVSKIASLALDLITKKE